MWTLALLALSAPGEDLEALCRTPPPVNFSPGPEYGAEARRFQGIPGLERAPGGRLWAVWYAGPLTEDRHNYIVGVTSGDDGQTWSDLQFVIDPDGDGPLRASDPCPWLDPSGRLWLFWFDNHTIGPIGSDKAPAPALFAMTCDDPDAAEPHWSAPRYLHDGIMMCKPIVLDNGDWLLPTAIWHREGSCRVVASTDQGQTWSLRGTATVPLSEDRNCDEPMMVQRRDSSLWMLVRTRYGIGETVSTDRGRTWSEVVPSTLAHPASRFFLRRLRSGNLLLVKHGPLTERTGRTHLTAYLSADDGASWQGGLLLDERGTVSYPDGTEAPDGTISIIYDWNRYDDKQILLARFTEADVLAGQPSPTTRLRRLVNQSTGVNPKPWLKDEPLNLESNADGEPLATGPAARLEAIGGTVQPVVAGGQVFTNRDYVWAPPPAPLGERQFIQAPIDGAEAVCTAPGPIWVATPTAARNRDSVAAALLAQGFAKVALPEFVLFLMSGRARGANAVTLYQKRVTAGESLRIGKWGVILF